MLRRLLHGLQSGSSMVVETVYPPLCPGCGRRGRWVCDTCFQKLERLAEPLCVRCGEVSPACMCAHLTPALDWIRSAAWHSGWLRTAILSFKYEGEFARAKHLAALMLPVMATCNSAAVMVPVPLHPDRQRSRGYNQSLKLATELSRTSDMLVSSELKRTVATKQQVRLNAIDRAQNVKDAFAVIDGATVQGGTFVLIDDVMTTGSTLGECAVALKQAGAVWVGAATVARERD